MAGSSAKVIKAVPIIIVASALAILAYSILVQKNDNLFAPMNIIAVSMIVFGCILIIVQSIVVAYRKHVRNLELDRRQSLVEAFEGTVQELYTTEPDLDLELEYRDENPFGFDEVEPDGLPDYNGLLEDEEEEGDLPTQRGSIKWSLKMLGISPDDMLNSKISMHDINKFYRLRSTLYHPDKYQNESDKAKRWANSKMMELNEAKSILYKAVESLTESDVD